MEYSTLELNLILADSFSQLTYRQKRELALSLDKNTEDSAKYAQRLIKTLGGGVYNKLREKICDEIARKNIVEKLEGKGIACVTVFSSGYPEPLANIPVPPLVLYCKGNVKLLKTRCFSVVGSRRTLAQGLALCKRVSEELTSCFTVVTGVACGADSAAAEGAFKSGKLICVLPYGHDIAEKAGNAHFIKNVAKNALVISEFPPETTPQRYLYLVRNRIIAGISDGVLVASAAKQSGALITANYAAEYGREVFTFPYSVGVVSGEGCNGLIKNGANLCENVLDIFACFGLEYNSEKEQSLTPDEQAVMNLLKEQGEAHVQAIANALDKRAFEITTVCSALEIKGLAVKTGGNKYAPTK